MPLPYYSHFAISAAIADADADAYAIASDALRRFSLFSLRLIAAFHLPAAFRQLFAAFAIQIRYSPPTFSLRPSSPLPPIRAMPMPITLGCAIAACHYAMITIFHACH